MGSGSQRFLFPVLRDQQKILETSRGIYSSPDLFIHARKDTQKSGATVPLSFFKYIFCHLSCFELLVPEMLKQCFREIVSMKVTVSILKKVESTVPPFWLYDPRRCEINRKVRDPRRVSASGAPHIVTCIKQTWIKHQCTVPPSARLQLLA